VKHKDKHKYEQKETRKTIKHQYKATQSNRTAASKRTRKQNKHKQTQAKRK
jgi:hypothetical protein